MTQAKNKGETMPAKRKSVEKTKTSRIVRLRNKTIMIAKGKDELEAALMHVIARIVDSENFDFEDKWLKDDDPVHKLNLKSLEWESMHAGGYLRLMTPESFFFEPRVYEFIKSYKEKLQTCVRMQGNLDTILRKVRKSRLIGDYLVVEDQLRALDQKVDLIVGFYLGLREFERRMASGLEKIRTEALSDYTVAWPKIEPKKQAANS